MAKLSDEKIIEIQKVYKEIGTYSGTAKVVGCSPATVKKYCMEEVTTNKSKQREKIPFTKEIPLIEDVVLDWNDPDSLFCLNNEEIEECKKFNNERF